ncbi:unnamed protein product [Parnassius mnemosyne]|uniref:Uncharacterized protein n=1 Tax=Parnassius mnemosyne TaxID=213953 RepID=A0AAV1KF58_9NEOP
MCCIFKYFSFTVDLIQRIWTFLMSCCIAGAICCLFFVVSMAGIALGYNYSISEFITLRNSQVSVFMKRDVTEDTSRGINWRHSKSEDQRRPFSNQGFFIC